MSTLTPAAELAESKSEASIEQFRNIMTSENYDSEKISPFIKKLSEPDFRAKFRIEYGLSSAERQLAIFKDILSEHANETICKAFYIIDRKFAEILHQNTILRLNQELLTTISDVKKAIQNRLSQNTVLTNPVLTNILDTLADPANNFNEAQYALLFRFLTATTKILLTAQPTKEEYDNYVSLTEEVANTLTHEANNIMLQKILPVIGFLFGLACFATAITTTFIFAEGTAFGISATFEFVYLFTYLAGALAYRLHNEKDSKQLDNKHERSLKIADNGNTFFTSVKLRHETYNKGPLSTTASAPSAPQGEPAEGEPDVPKVGEVGETEQHCVPVVSTY